MIAAALRERKHRSSAPVLLRVPALRALAQFQNHDAYDPANGTQLKIVGAEMGEPDQSIVPEVK